MFKLVVPLFPIEVEQPPYAGSDLTSAQQVLPGGRGAAIASAVTIVQNGTVTGSAYMKTSSDVWGEHAGVMLLLYDYTGFLIWSSPVEICWVDGTWFGNPNWFSWTWNVPQDILPSVRNVALVQQLSPRGIGADLTHWLSQIGSAVSAVASIVKAVTTIFS